MKIKIISFNIHKGMGWRTRKSTIYEINQQINLLNPDIIFFQEIKGNHFELFINEKWTHQSYGKNVIYPKGDHGNAILSKFPITYAKNINLTSSTMERRGLLHAIVHINNAQQAINLLCVHLGLFQNDRIKQVSDIVRYINNNINHDQPLILAGDFNDWSNMATLPLIHDLRLDEAFLNLYGSYARTFPAWAPLLRLDRIYYRGFDVEKAYRIIQNPWKLLSDHIAVHASLSMDTNFLFRNKNG